MKNRRALTITDPYLKNVLDHLQHQLEKRILDAIADFETGTEIAERITTAIVDFIIEDTARQTVEQAIADFITENAIDSKITDAVADFETATEIANRIRNALTDYRTATQISTLITDAVADFRSSSQITTEISNALADYRTETQINDLIEAYGEAFTTALKTKLDGIEDGAQQNIEEVTVLPAPADAEKAKIYNLRDDNDALQRSVVKDFRANPSFSVAVADLGNGNRGFAATGYSGLGRFALDAGGSREYSELGAISERFLSMANADFYRVGSYTFTQTGNAGGLASDGTLLYIFDNRQIKGFNPDTGTVSFTSGNVGRDFTGLAVVGGFAWGFRQDARRFVRIGLPSGRIEIVGGFQTNEPRQFAEKNGTLYAIVGSNQFGTVNVNGVFNRIGFLSGFSGTGGAVVKSFANLNGEFYTVIEQNSVQRLYRINETTAALTDRGTINPSNANLQGLAPLGNSLYAFNDADNGIYRFDGGQGNQWIVIFPTDTTEVDADDTTLKLFVGTGADEIELIRQTDITTAIVFATDFDGESAHTINIGDNESMALYKANDEQLYEGAYEAIFREIDFKEEPIGNL